MSRHSISFTQVALALLCTQIGFTVSQSTLVEQLEALAGEAPGAAPAIGQDATGSTKQNSYIALSPPPRNTVGTLGQDFLAGVPSSDIINSAVTAVLQAYGVNTTPIGSSLGGAVQSLLAGNESVPAASPSQVGVPNLQDELNALVSTANQLTGGGNNNSAATNLAELLAVLQSATSSSASSSSIAQALSILQTALGVVGALSGRAATM